MGLRFQELGWRQTPMGQISLRRRWDPQFETEVYEVKLDDDFLMSSLFTVAEVEVARLALAELSPADFGAEALDVAVGGLGLGFTALTVLEDDRVGSLLVVDALADVIEWHEQGLIPAGATLTADPRCRLVTGDFFALTAGADGLDPQSPGRLFHAIVVDIDHSPSHLLHPSHADFYQPAGLRRLAERLHPGGVFTLWSNDPPEDDFTARLAEVFTEVRADVIAFANPLQDRDSTNTVYLAKRAG
ncbi:spermidine synthase [Catellatospora sp. KI3]|uniref:spermidine synthase n=1 Tax=Catellatospora sp. KI3 TaxID=3041620 RepID=UPI00248262DF|nr:spermidine synthase [Catellatospora sp. KI3]MDI1460775.1 spermidine synthase [Catellatospora sp. KI3]